MLVVAVRGRPAYSQSLKSNISRCFPEPEQSEGLKRTTMTFGTSSGAAIILDWSLRAS